MSVGVFRGFNVDAARRASRRTQKAAHALFQPVFVPMQNVNPAIPSLEVDRLFGIILRDGFRSMLRNVTLKPFTKVMIVSPASFIIEDIDFSV